MKKLLLLFLTGFILLSAYILYPFILRTVFGVSGTAQITPEHSERAKRPNTMLFLVAKNESGVPVAVKKIINPSFPQTFQITPSDLILPDVLTVKLRVEAFLNNHGEIGVFKGEDLKSQTDQPCFIFSKKVSVIIDTPAK